MEDSKIIKCHCNQCGHETNHLIISKRENIESQEIHIGNVPKGLADSFEVRWTTFNIMLECCGCSDVCLKRMVRCSESWDEDPEITYYPPRVSRRKPVWFHRLPKEYSVLLEEIYSSLHADNRALSTMGARAVIDLFINRKVGDCGTFDSGLNKLVDENYITIRNKEIIKSAIEIGHAATHRAYKPTSKQLDSLMDIVENLIQQDLLEESAKSLKKSTPARSLTKKEDITDVLN